MVLVMRDESEAFIFAGISCAELLCDVRVNVLVITEPSV